MMDSRHKKEQKRGYFEGLVDLAKSSSSDKPGTHPNYGEGNNLAGLNHY